MLIPDLNQCVGSGFIDSGFGFIDSGSGSKVLKTKNWKKFTVENKFFDQKLQFTYPKLQEKKPTALKREHPALLNIKFHNFFLFLWVIFALLDPEPDPQT
jgi:hypothetical protein